MVRQALLILLIGLSASALRIVVGGLPALIRPAAETATCSGPLPERPMVRWISPSDAEALLGKPEVAFVDTRDRDDYEAGHISAALHAPMDRGTLDERLLGSLRGTATVIVYCDAVGQCARSTRFASLLSAAGQPDVRVLEGGIGSWIESGRPAESGECRQCP